MRYDTDDSARPIPEIPLELLSSMAPPPDEMLDASWE